MTDKKNQKLGDYIRSMVARHPGLNNRQASLRAGLNENAIQQILSLDRTQPSPITLKKLADTWGTSQDYRTLMRLSGYDIPEPIEMAGLSEVKRQAIELLVDEAIPDRLAASMVAALREYLSFAGDDAPAK